MKTNIMPELTKIIEFGLMNSRSDSREMIYFYADKLRLKFEKEKDPKKKERLDTCLARMKQKFKACEMMQLPSSGKGMDLVDLYMPIDCSIKSKRLVLSKINRQIVDEFIRIMHLKEEFDEQEVPMPNKIIMFGPPGTGKTLTAFLIASELELPLVLVRLDSLMSSYLGETAQNLRKIFEYTKKTPCVLFLDEFDSIAMDRNEKGDVGELKRVVNSLLQNLDSISDDTIVIAATNLDDSLDLAVWRRFDTRMKYELPSTEERNQYLQLLIKDETLVSDSVEMLEGASFADIEQIINKAKRKTIINGRNLSLSLIREAFCEYTRSVDKE